MPNHTPRPTTQQEAQTKVCAITRFRLLNAAAEAWKRTSLWRWMIKFRPMETVSSAFFRIASFLDNRAAEHCDLNKPNFSWAAMSDLLMSLGRLKMPSSSTRLALVGVARPWTTVEKESMSPCMRRSTTNCLLATSTDLNSKLTQRTTHELLPECDKRAVSQTGHNNTIDREILQHTQTPASNRKQGADLHTIESYSTCCSDALGLGGPSQRALIYMRNDALSRAPTSMGVGGGGGGGGDHDRMHRKLNYCYKVNTA